MWSKLHLITIIPAFAVFWIVAILMRKWLINKSEKIRMIPIQVIAVLLVVLEIIKQINAIVVGYNLKVFPLYYCSLFVFLYPVMAFYNGKYKNKIRSLTLCSGFALFTLMLLIPAIIYGSSCIENFFKNYNDFHTVFFHNLVILGTFLIVSLKLFEVDPQHDYLLVCMFYLSFCVIVAPIANLTKTNFHNFCYNHASIIENIRLQWVANWGEFLGQTLYVLVATVLTVSLSVLMYFIMVQLFNFSNKLQKNINKKIEILDLYNANDEKLNKTIFRGEKPAENEYIKLAVVYIKSGNKYLMQKCSEQKGGEFAVTGGHVSAGNSGEEQAVIEVKEELGFDIDKTKLIFVGNMFKGKAIFAVYLYEDKNLIDYNFELQTEEVAEVCWLTKTEIEDLIGKGVVRESTCLHYNKFIK